MYPPRVARASGVSRGHPSRPSMIQGIECPWVTRMTSGEMLTSAPFLPATVTNNGGPSGKSVEPVAAVRDRV
eukprot:14740945-Alexandrium_andersonii.AAC.1